MAEQKTLDGKVAIITGSSSGIGAATAYEFASKGAKLTLSGRDKERLQEVAVKCQNLSPNNIMPLLVIGDLADETTRESLVTTTIEHFGCLDILINNAGYFKTGHLLDEKDTTILDEMLDIHVRVPYHLTKLSAKHLIKSNGNVVNISTRASIKPVNKIGIEYSLAKCVLDQLTRWTAMELGPKGVRANTVNPGSVATGIAYRSGMDPKVIQKMYEGQAKVHTLGRVGKPEEVAKAIAFLASEEASFVSGETLLVDGGNSVVPALPPETPYIN